MSELSRLILEKICELFVGTKETVRIKQVSIERGSTVYLKIVHCRALLTLKARIHPKSQIINLSCLLYV